MKATRNLLDNYALCIWKDRNVVCEAIVLPEADDILLGAIPLEAMDLIINPKKQEVVGAHGDEAMHKIY